MKQMRMKFAGSRFGDQVPEGARSRYIQRDCLTPGGYMRTLISLFGALLLFAPAAAAAQDWQEFISIEDRLHINFPGQPTLENVTYESEDGMALPARRWSARKGEEYYAVTVVNFAGHYDFYDTLIWSSMAWAATTFRRQVPLMKDLTYDAYMRMNRVPGHALQIRKSDGGFLYVLIVLHQDEALDTRRLYITEAHVPAGKPPPGLFQQAFAVTNAAGETIRYTADGLKVDE
jgi:hypothetical protein